MNTAPENAGHSDDAALLRRYVDENAEDAFAEIVRRHVGLVYHAALRQMEGDAARAEDVTQIVFTDLARKATSLAQRPVLTGWLYTSTRFAALKARRTERRRMFREQEAHAMQDALSPEATAADWDRLQPVIDDALHALDERDREAVLLRFFEGRSFADVGARLAFTEDTARKRVERALEKMRVKLARAGVTSTSAALAAALANQAGITAPAGLAASVTAAALTGGGAAVAGAGTWAVFMSMSKLQVAIVTFVAAGGAAAYVVQAATNGELRREIAALTPPAPAVAALRAENQQFARTAAEVEALQRDDVDWKQLEQRVAEVKQAGEERARLAQARAQDQRRQFYERMRADDQRAQQEIERMNREGNVLVGEYRTLSTQAKDPALTPEARAAADVAAKAKLEAIKLKQQEIRAFTENVRSSLVQRLEAFRRAYGDDPNTPPPTFQTGAGRLELAPQRANGEWLLRRVPGEAGNPANPPSVSGEIKAVPSP